MSKGVGARLRRSGSALCMAYESESSACAWRELRGFLSVDL
jgi:hypothetical protein